MKKRSFLPLYEEVIKKDRCSICGSCVLACPLNLLDFREQVFFTDHKKKSQVSKGAVIRVMEKCISCSRCYEACPKTGFNLQIAEKDVFGTELQYDVLGEVKEVFSVHASDLCLSTGGQSGGAVTALLKFALESGAVDCVIVAGSSADAPWEPIPVIVTKENIQDLYGSQRTKYFPSSMIVALSEAIKERGFKKIAITILPCQAHGLYNLEKMIPNKLLRGVKIIKIGMFCFGTYWGNQFLDWLQRKHNIHPNEIKRMKLDRRNFSIEANSGKHVSGERKKIMKFMLQSCEYCEDFTNVLSDISVGATGSPPGWSTFIVRTAEGLSLLQAAEEAKFLVVEPTSSGMLDEIYELATLKFKYHVNRFSLKTKEEKIAKMFRKSIDLATTASAGVLFLQINVVSGLPIYQKGLSFKSMEKNAELYGGLTSAILSFSRTLTQEKGGLRLIDLGMMKLIIESSNFLHAFAIVSQESEVVRQRLRNVLNQIEKVVFKNVVSHYVELSNEQYQQIERIVRSELIITGKTSFSAKEKQISK